VKERGWASTPRERMNQLAALRWARRQANVDENAVFVGGCSRGLAGALVVISLLAPAASFAANSKLAAIRIDNFGAINDNYYRGAQPKDDDYRDLATIGVKTIVDLTKDGRDDEPGLVKSAGMKFYRIPLTTSERPSDAAIAEFLKIVNDPANQPVYVHCQGGRHRTGTMTAIFHV
jgi:protein tyrosine/serine phosphatase